MVVVVVAAPAVDVGFAAGPAEFGDEDSDAVAVEPAAEALAAVADDVAGGARRVEEGCGGKLGAAGAEVARAEGVFVEGPGPGGLVARADLFRP